MGENEAVLNDCLVKCKTLPRIFISVNFFECCTQEEDDPWVTKIQQEERALRLRIVIKFEALS